MTTSLPFQITVCGIGDLAGYRQARVTHVLSILDPGAPVPADFAAFAAHDRLELRFNDIIDEQPDMLCPRPEDVESLLRFVQQLLDEPRDNLHLLVHCHAGFSRSTASTILILAKARPELPASTLIEELVRIRPRLWPNLRIVELGDELLGRRGEIITATRHLYGMLLERDPDLHQLLRGGGRGREVDAALPSSRYQ